MNNNGRRNGYYEAKRKNPLMRYVLIWGMIILALAVIFFFTIKPKRIEESWTQAQVENYLNAVVADRETNKETKNYEYDVEQINIGDSYIHIYYTQAIYSQESGKRISLKYYSIMILERQYLIIYDG